MSEFVTSVGQTLCTLASFGSGSAQCYNAASMQVLGTCFLIGTALVTAGYKLLSRF